MLIYGAFLLNEFQMNSCMYKTFLTVNSFLHIDWISEFDSYKFGQLYAKPQFIYLFDQCKQTRNPLEPINCVCMYASRKTVQDVEGACDLNLSQNKQN